MATIINNPPPIDDGRGAGGLVVGLVALVVVVMLFIFLVLPALRSAPNDTGGGVNNQTPDLEINVQEQ